MYRSLDAAVVRVAAGQPEWAAGPWPDITGQTGAASWCAWLRNVAQIGDFAAAVEQASPALATRVREICDGRPVSERTARRAGLSVMRYLLRAAGRATPFGLFAGVAPARVAARPAVRAGSAHRAVAAVDAGWLAAMIERLESDAALRPRLTVLANNLAFERDGRLVLEHRPGRAARDAPARVSVRATAPVRAAIRLARDPIKVEDLAGRLAAGFAGVPRAVVDQLVADLVVQRLLLTNLRCTMTVSSPLSHLLPELEELSAGQVTEVAETIHGLREIAGLLAHHNSAPTLDAAREQRERITRAMGCLHPTRGPALAVDLRMDWTVAIPHAVAEEAAEAAAVLVRLAGRRSLSPGWEAWHARFLERYGPLALVPVGDAVDAGIGIGYPAGYRGGGASPSAAGLTSRDRKLLALAQNAALRGQREIVLDETLISSLEEHSGLEMLVQPTTELTVRVHAPSVDALDSGDFVLTVVGVSRAAGTVTGRFLALFDDQDRNRMARAYANRPTSTRGALTVQISAPPRYIGTENVARAPQVLPHVLHLGEYHQGGAGPAAIALEDIAVTADAHRVYLVSRSRLRPVEPVVLNAVEPANHAHPLVRFLTEAPVAFSVPCTAFDWGAAATLPFLPALRYRRTVLSPARWLLTSADLPGPAAGPRTWDAALSTWQDETGPPRHVHLGDGDQRIPLDLSEPAHRTLLRTQVERAGTVSLRAMTSGESTRTETGGAAAWAGGRAHELVIPLATTRPPASAPAWSTRETAGPQHGHPPGCGGRFFVKLYGPPDRHDDILLRHLPVLLDVLSGQGDHVRWWFVRYHDPGEHLRVRVTVPAVAFAPAATAIGDWTRRLRMAGLVARVQWDTDFPETARFGGGEALAAAEAYFAADSAAALAQLAVADAKDGPDVRSITAASLLDIAIGLIGDAAEAMRWLVDHTRTTAPAPPRALYDQALVLANPDDHSAVAAHTGGERLITYWIRRRQALAIYRNQLEEAGTAGTRRAPEVLPDLLHLHHARMAGTDLEAEAACLHLARAAALSWTARATRRP